MICDQLCVFTDNQPVRADGVSEAVAVMPFLGKGKAVNLVLAAKEAYPDHVSLEVLVQESADKSNFADLCSLRIPKGTLARQELFQCALPKNLKKPWVRLAYTLSGAPSSGKLWAGLSMDVAAPMEAGQDGRPPKAV